MLKLLQIHAHIGAGKLAGVRELQPDWAAVSNGTAYGGEGAIELELGMDQRGAHYLFHINGDPFRNGGTNPYAQEMRIVISILAVSFLPDFQLRENAPIVYRVPTDPAAVVSGQPIPDLSHRSPRLRPAAIPEGVRYVFARDSAVAAADAALQSWFLNNAHSASPLFGDGLVVHPGAWVRLKGIETIGKKAATRWDFSVWDGHIDQKLSGIVIRDKGELKQIEDYIRLVVHEAGGARVRAFTSEEMTRWWPFIGFDIHEPTLVLETDNKAYRFVFGFLDGRTLILDELGGLPNWANHSSAPAQSAVH